MKLDAYLLFNRDSGEWAVQEITFKYRKQDSGQGQGFIIYGSSIADTSLETMHNPISF